MHIEEIIQKIVPADRGCMKLAQTRFDNLIKPVGSLAKLAAVAEQYALTHLDKPLKSYSFLKSVLP